MKGRGTQKFTYNVVFGKHLEDLRVAEVEQLDIRIEENKVVEYRARVRASFRYHPDKH